LDDGRFKTVMQINPSSPLNRTQLMKLRVKAIRAGVWFRALPRIDRVLVDLTLKVASTVRSPSLARSILSVVRKLEQVFESKLVRAMRQVGVSLAWKLSVYAQQWGNKAAREWANDSGFARYLAVMNLNGHLR
jgi:hypothetical protein